MTELDIQQGLFWKRSSGSRVIIPNFTPRGWFEADVWRVTKAGITEEYEVKLTLTDFKADVKKCARYGRRGWTGSSSRETKHQRLFAGDVRGPHRFFFVVPRDLEYKVTPLLPDWAGLVLVRPGSRCAAMDWVKKAPRLHNQPWPAEEESRVLQAMYWRYWRLREKMKSSKITKDAD